MRKSLFTAFAVGLCLSVNVMAQVPSYVPTNGLVGWWPFNGNANDESGNGNNGTVNGATLTADRFGVANKAYSFDGVDDFVNVAYNNSFNSFPISINLWVNTNSNQRSGIVNFYEGCSNNGWAITSTTGQSFSAYYFSSNGSYINLDNNSILLNGSWKMITTVFQSDSCFRYINGILVDASSFNFLNQNANSSSTNTNLTFGKMIESACQVNNGPYFFNGKMDEIAIYNRSISDCEIQDLYNSQINSVVGSILTSTQSATVGSAVTLSSTTTSQSLQWQTNGVNLGWQNVPSNTTYSGGSTNTLTVNNVQLSNHNQPFRLIASNGNCTDTSNVATIQIADTCITNVTVYDTLQTTVTDTLIINTTLSLPAPNNENTILIYPNPASDHITIDNGNYTAMAGYTIKIENNAGQQVFQSLINQAQFYVDLSTWSGNGLYFVHLIDAQGNTVTVRKIVLQ